MTLAVINIWNASFNQNKSFEEEILPTLAESCIE